MVWTWVGERHFGQSSWKGGLPFLERSKPGVGRWEAGACWAFPDRWQVGRWKPKPAVPGRGLGLADPFRSC